MTTLTNEISERVRKIETTPAIPMVLQPLLKLLSLPIDEIEVDQIVRLVSYDNTIAAQCLRVANSPLFGLVQPPQSISAVVIALGLRRVESILLTCCMGQAFPAVKSGLDSATYWKHSLGCAMVCRKFCDKLKGLDREKAYIAGLLHDIGFLVNALVLPEKFASAIQIAKREQIPLDQAEAASMGFTHCETGKALAENWGINSEIANAIAYHHSVESCPEPRAIACVVHLCDLMCRMRALDYGYYERHKVELAGDPAWTFLAEEHPEMKDMDIELFTFELDESISEVSDLVSTILGSAAK